MQWFKFYGQDYLTDLKMISMSLPDRQCYITLLCLASAADEGGLIRNCSEETIVHMTHLTGTDSSAAVGCLQRYAALQCVTLHCNGDVTVNNYERRQGKNLSNAERQKTYRERLKTKGKSHNERNVTRYNDSNARIEENRIDKSTLTSVSVARAHFGEFKNVLLTEAEHLNLTTALGEDVTNSLIAELSTYIASTGKRYKSHYATLQGWARRKMQDHHTAISKKGKGIIV